MQNANIKNQRHINISLIEVQLRESFVECLLEGSEA